MRVVYFDKLEIAEWKQQAEGKSSEEKKKPPERKSDWQSFRRFGTRQSRLKSVPTATGTKDKTADTNTAVFSGAYIK